MFNSAVDLDAFAQQLLTGQPEVYASGLSQPEPMVLWVGYLYGYRYTHTVWEDFSRYNNGFTMFFVRNDSPDARRRAAWMRSPQADPAFPPPVGWRTDGSWGFHPPGWHPSVRLNPPPPAELAPFAALLAQTQNEGNRSTGEKADRGVQYALLRTVVIFVLALVALFVREGGHLDPAGVVIALVVSTLFGILPLIRIRNRRRRLTEKQQCLANSGTTWRP